MTEILSEVDEKKPSEDGNSVVEIDHEIKVPIVVICDEYTASSGEIFTSAIRDYRNAGLLNATIVGTTTYKKGIMQNTYTYSDGSSATFTVAYYNPPSGVNYHGVGITPDVLVDLPAQEYNPETGEPLPINDTQLERALEEIKKLINAN
jgi:carboxyl-terminal processing protease